LITLGWWIIELILPCWWFLKVAFFFCLFLFCVFRFFFGFL
jgi:hypothetical protein